MSPPSGQAAAGAMWYKSILQSTVCPFPNADQYSSKPRGFETPDQLVWGIVVGSNEAAAGCKIRILIDGVELVRTNVVAGLNYGTAPSITGHPSLELLDGSGRTVFVADGGRCISSNCPDCIYNMVRMGALEKEIMKADGILESAGGWTETRRGFLG